MQLAIPVPLILAPGSLRCWRPYSPEQEIEILIFSSQEALTAGISAVILPRLNCRQAAIKKCVCVGGAGFEMLLSYRRREGCIVCARRSCWLRFQELLCKPLGPSAGGDEGSSRRGISPRSCLNVFPRGHRAGAEGISVEALIASRQELSSDGSAVRVCTSARAHKHKHIFIFTITSLQFNITSYQN